MIRERGLIALPIVVYLISYLYLASYHQKFFLFNTVTHENGTYTFLQTMFYATHFLGHVPVHTVLAFVFIGVDISLTDFTVEKYPETKVRMLFMLLIIFLILSFVISLTVFGQEDTFSFICQQKQNAGIYARGGSWNLHLPSTLLLFFLIPVYLIGIKKLFKRNIDMHGKGLPYIITGILLFLSFTAFLNGNIAGIFLSTWKDPRYLAHSVREVITFPLTYFPPALYFILRATESNSIPEAIGMEKRHRYLIVFLTVAFLIGFLYQAYVPLSEGIGNLAQKPSFAKNGRLGVPYLLASHFFEHFLDIIYFTLMCLLLYGLATRRLYHRREIAGKITETQERQIEDNSYRVGVTSA
jgi:hypothetical protein